MDCGHIEQELRAYVHGELDSAVFQIVDAHLTTCKACAAKLNFLRATDQAVRGLPPAMLPMNAQVRILFALDREQPLWSRVKKIFSKIFHPKDFWNGLPLAFRTGVVALTVGIIAITAKSHFPVSTQNLDRGAPTELAKVNVAIKNIKDDQWWSGKPYGVSPTGVSANNFGNDRIDTPDQISTTNGVVESVIGGNTVLQQGAGASFLKLNLEGAAAAPANLYRGSNGMNEARKISSISANSIDPKIIRTAQLNLEVKKVSEATVQDIEKLATQSGGFIANSNAYAQNDQRRGGSIEVRVSSTAFNRVLGQLETLGKILNRTVNGQNVTEEFVDLESRLRNAEKVEDRIQSFLKLAKSSKDAVLILQELDQITERIEQIKGRLRYLNHSVAWSTITVNFSEPQIIALSPEPKGLMAYFKGVFQDIVQSSFSTFASVIKGLSVTFAFIFPIAALCGAAAWIYLKVSRRSAGISTK